MNVLSLFDGISCGRIALERAGVVVENYYSSEIDKHAISVSDYNYPDIVRLGDVTRWREWNLPKIDLILAGSPCQGFSYAGRQLAFDDPRSKLFFEFINIMNHLRPEFYLLENVRMKQEHVDVIEDYLGKYSAVITHTINSSLVSAQNRVRQYWTNFPFSSPEDRGITLQDIVPLAEGVYTIPRGFNKGGIKRGATKSPCVTSSSWQHNFFWTDYLDIKHRFTPEMVEEFQTVPLGYTSAVSNNQRYRLLGNGWTVEVVSHILEGLSNA